jgi:predicted N-acetyltransferase YhbS
MLIRSAIPADADAVRRLGEDAFAETRRIYRPSAAALSDATATQMLDRLVVAEETGRLIGTVRYRVDGCRLRVIGLAVLPEQRRRHVARDLIEALIPIAREHGCRTLALYTVTKTGNVPIFERLGFRVISESPDDYSVSVTGEPLVAAYMERSIE